MLSLIFTVLKQIEEFVRWCLDIITRSKLKMCGSYTTISPVEKFLMVIYIFLWATLGIETKLADVLFFYFFIYLSREERNW